LFIAAPGAIKPAHHVVGHVPATDEAGTIPEATKLITALGKQNKYDAVVVDDFSLLAEQTVIAIEKGGLTGLKLWGEIRKQIVEFRNAARHLGMHVILNAHESTPRTINGSFIRGGPRLPGRMPEDLPTACDLVLRAVHEPNKRGWHAVYRCSIDDPNWVTKDRHGICPDPAPMNTSEILRAAGYRLRRAPGLEWQEEIVETLAHALVESPAEEADLMKVALELCGKHTQNPLAIRWTMRDALDRAYLIRTRDPLAMFLQ
jgi:hypothetical protein